MDAFAPAGLLLWGFAISVGVIGCLAELPSMIGLFTGFAVSMLSCVVGSWLWGRFAHSRPVASTQTILLPLFSLLLASLLGAVWGLWNCQQSLAQRLPLAEHGADFDLQLQVVSLPQSTPAVFAFGRTNVATSKASKGRQRFYDVKFSARVINSQNTKLLDQKLDLTWYRASAEQRQAMRAGSMWQMTVRLKRPRGSVNPHTFDYEGWLLQRGIYATGYVRDRDSVPHFLGQQGGVLARRQQLRDQLEQAGLKNTALLSALVLGDKGSVDQQTRKMLRDTGTAHLLAISGLHVGMVAGFCLVIGRLLARLIGVMSLLRVVNSRVLTAGFGLAGAVLYTIIAGAPLSAQRALVMTAVLLAAWTWRRRISSGLAFAFALAAVMALQPLAFLNPGFWLSFIAVAALLLTFNGRYRLRSVDRNPMDGEQSDKRIFLNVSQLRSWLLSAIRSQWVVILALLLPSLLFFSGFSASGLLLNLIAIPWLGLLILPALLLGTALASWGAGQWLLQLADWQLGCLIQFLVAGERALPSWQNWMPLTGPSMLVVSLSVLMLLLPRGLPGRGLGWLLLLPILVAGGRGDLEETDYPPQLTVNVLDVGQGLAVAVRTRGHTLVYDTGPSTPSGWSAGSQIIAPYLIGEGIGAVDTLVVSHGDRDHAGGVLGLFGSLPVKSLVAPGTLRTRLARGMNKLPTSECIAGAPADTLRPSTTDEWQLTWLWPRSGGLTGEENDHSCVALIEWQGVRLLLAGDISRKVEQKLALAYPGFAPVDLLLAPHHGSRTSSSAALVQWAKPARVVFSSGFRHHFGHPHRQVVERYEAAGTALYNTADSGALEFVWALDGGESGSAQELVRRELLRTPAIAPVIAEARQGGRFWYADHTNEKDAE